MHALQILTESCLLNGKETCPPFAVVFATKQVKTLSILYIRKKTKVDIAYPSLSSCYLTTFMR